MNDEIQATQRRLRQAVVEQWGENSPEVLEVDRLLMLAGTEPTVGDTQVARGTVLYQYRLRENGNFWIDCSAATYGLCPENRRRLAYLVASTGTAATLHVVTPNADCTDCLGKGVMHEEDGAYPCPSCHPGLLLDLSTVSAAASLEKPLEAPVAWTVEQHGERRVSWGADEPNDPGYRWKPLVFGHDAKEHSVQAQQESEPVTQEPTSNPPTTLLNDSTSTLELLISVWSMRPQPGTPCGDAWEDGARWGWSKRQSF